MSRTLTPDTGQRGQPRHRCTWQHAVRVLRQNASTPADASQYSSAVNVCGKDGRGGLASCWQQALLVFSEMSQRGLQLTTVTYNATIDACGRAKRWQAAVALFAALRCGSVQASIVSYSTLVSACGRAGAWGVALGILEEAETSSTAPNVITYNAAASALEKAGEWQLAVQLLGRMEGGGLQGDEITMKSVMGACARAGEWELALFFFAGLESRGLRPNAFHSTTAVQACATAAAWTRALAIFEAVTSQLPPASGIYSAAITVCGRAEKWEMALCLFREAQLHVEASQVIANAAIGACSRGQQWQQAVSVLAGMSGDTLATDIVSYNACISSCESRHWQRVLDLLHAARAQTLRPTASTYSAGVTVCGAASRWVEALLLLQESTHHLAPSLVVFNAAVAALGRAAAWAQALSLLHHAASLLEVDVITYNAAVTACEGAAEWQQALRVLAALRSSGLEADVISYNAAMSACEKAEEAGPALDLFAELCSVQLQPTLVSFSAAASACEKVAHWEQALGLLASAAARGVQPDVVLYNAVLAACEKAARWPAALQLFATLTHARLEPSSVSVAAPLSALAKGSRWQLSLVFLADLAQGRLHAFAAPEAALGAYQAAQWHEPASDLERVLIPSLAMAVPEGYDPVVAFKLCPPGGIMFQLGLYIFDIINDVVQIGTFVYHGDFWFAAFMVVFIGLSLLLTFTNMATASHLKRFDPLGEAKLMLMCERVVEAPGTGLIGPYGASLLALTPLQAASALYGLISSAKAMAEGRLDQEAAVGSVSMQSYSLKAVRPVKAGMLTAWYFGAFAGELAAFAVVSATLHPLVTLPGYALGALANGAAEWSGGEGYLWMAAFSCMMVALAMAGAQTRSFTKYKTPEGPGFIPALFILCRLCAWAALCGLDLPQGLLPLGSLGRPMGFPVLREKFLEPAAACREALLCFTSQMWMTTETEANSTVMSFSAEVGFHACSWPATRELNPPSAIFNTCLLFLAVVLVPIHMCVVVAMLFLNPLYACGADNRDLKEEVKAKQVEIDEFARQNKEMNGEYTELCMLSDCDSSSEPSEIDPKALIKAHGSFVQDRMVPPLVRSSLGRCTWRLCFLFLGLAGAVVPSGVPGLGS
eukprot:s2010_g13.t3